MCHFKHKRYDLFLLFKLPQFVAESKMFDLHLLVSVYLSIQEKM